MRTARRRRKPTAASGSFARSEYASLHVKRGTSPSPAADLAPRRIGRMVDDPGGLRNLMREAAAHKPLQPGEQTRLLKAAGEGDQASQERLVAAYLPIVVRLAAASSDHGLSVPDLVQEGSIGLLQAVRDFVASGEPDFATFAEARIPLQLSNPLQ